MGTAALSKMISEIITLISMVGFIFTLSSKAENVVKVDKKKVVSDYLLSNPNIKRTISAWHITFTTAFDSIFGEEHLSWKRFSRSCVASLVSVIIVILTMYSMFPEEILSSFGSIKGLKGLLSITFFVNFIFDYLSIVETRWIIKKIGNNNLLLVFSLLLLDLCLTALIAIGGYVLLSFVAYSFFLIFFGLYIGMFFCVLLNFSCNLIWNKFNNNLKNKLMPIDIAVCIFYGFAGGLMGLLPSNNYSFNPAEGACTAICIVVTFAYIKKKLNYKLAVPFVIVNIYICFSFFLTGSVYDDGLLEVNRYSDFGRAYSLFNNTSCAFFYSYVGFIFGYKLIVNLKKKLKHRFNNKIITSTVTFLITFLIAFTITYAGNIIFFDGNMSSGGFLTNSTAINLIFDSHYPGIIRYCKTSIRLLSGFLFIEPLKSKDIIKGVWFYSSFFTSIWIWLYVVASWLIKMKLRFRWATRGLGMFLDIENKPFEAIGFVSSLIVIILFLGFKLHSTLFA